jgi:hypothetical protein
MKLYFDNKCPICHKGITNTTIAVRCLSQGHYYYSLLSHYVNVLIAPNLLLQYTQFDPGPQTTILKSYGDPGSISLFHFREVFRLNHHFELDWGNLEAAAKRINNLIIFS